MKVILINPVREFGSTAQAVRLCGGEIGDADYMHLFEVRMIAMLVDSNGMPHAFACSFLSYVALISRSLTGDTVRTYAEGLIPWLQFLQNKKVLLFDATEEHLNLYKNLLVNASGSDGIPIYASTTANSRVVIAAGFHIWGQREGTMPSKLGEYLWRRKVESRGQCGAGRGYAHRVSDSLLPRVTKRLPRVLSREELSRLFIVAPSEYKLMFRWAATTGLRRFEICNLKLSSLPTADQIASRGMELVPIDLLRKGSRLLTVQAPARLVEETLWYVASERPEPVDRRHRDLVFLSRRRKPYSRTSVSRAFRKCADLIGSVATLHHLRHTFAVNVLAILESFEDRDRAMNSMKTLQILMGHANVTTTETYLQALEATSDEVRDALDFLYGAVL